jgi:hypothetical protein
LIAARRKAASRVDRRAEKGGKQTIAGQPRDQAVIEVRLRHPLRRFRQAVFELEVPGRQRRQDIAVDIGPAEGGGQKTVDRRLVTIQPALGQDRHQADPGRRQVGIDGQRARIEVLGRLLLAEFGHDLAQAGQDRRRIRVQFEGAAVPVESLGKRAPAAQQAAEVAERIGEIGVELDGAAVMPLGLVEAALARPHDTQVVVGAGPVGVEVEGAFEGLGGVIEPALAFEHIAERGPRRREFGSMVERRTQMRFGLGIAFQAAECGGEPVEYGDVRRRPRERDPIGFLGAVEITLMFAQQAEILERLRVPRLGAQDTTVQRLGLLEVAPLMGTQRRIQRGGGVGTGHHAFSSSSLLSGSRSRATEFMQ